MNAYIPSRAPAVALTGVLFVCFVALTNGPARGQGIEPPAPIQRVSIDDLTERLKAIVRNGSIPFPLMKKEKQSWT